MTSRVRISKTFVDSQSEPGKYRDDRLIGFGLKITKAGKKVYFVEAKLKGTRRAVTVTIGPHGAWTPEKARDEARKHLADLSQGIDPNEQRRIREEEHAEREREEKEESRLDELTLSRVFGDWSSQAQAKDGTKNLYRDVVFKHLADWLDKPFNSISRDMISHRYLEVCQTTVSSANNTFRALRRLFNWARSEYRDSADNPLFPLNPVSVLSDKGMWRKVAPRDLYIEDADLPAWFTAVNRLSDHCVRDYYILLLLTGLRAGEAGGLLWSDVNFKRGTFKARDTKNGRDLVLPMTDFVVELFKTREAEQDGKFVFPASNQTGHIDDVRKFEKLVRMDSGVEFTPHALRRTFSYAAARVKLGESERKALLNHLDKANITDLHYTPWQVNDLREPLSLVQNFLLEKIGIRPVQKVPDVV